MSSKVSYLWIAGTIALLAAWIPFLWLSFYNVPIGMHEWEWMTDYAGRFEGEWWQLQQHLYQNVMGRFTSNAFLSLTSSWCSLSAFPVFFFLWQLVWFSTILMLIRKVICIKSWWPAFLFATGIQIAYLAQLEDVYDSLFRFTALWTYQLGFILAAFAAIFLLSKQSLIRVAGYVLLFLVVGTNEISMFFALTVSAVLFFYHWRIKKNRWLPYLVAFAVSLMGTLIVILAPGNDLRMESEAAGIEFSQWIMMTLATSAFIWIDWIGSMHLVMIILLAVVFFGYSAVNMKSPAVFNDHRPWLIILFLFVPFCMAALLYSTGGNAFPERVIDHMFSHVIIIVLGLMMSIIVRYDLFHRVNMVNEIIFIRRSMLVIIGILLIHVFTQGITVDRKNKSHQGNYLSLISSESNILNAWLVLIKGDAARYQRESLAELNSLRSCRTSICFMRKPSILPEQLYDPLSDRRNRNGDGYIGYYFHPAIKTVRYLQIE